MCGIVGVYGEDAVRRSIAGLEKIGERGRDGCGIAFEGRITHADSVEQLREKTDAAKSDAALCHCLHSIVGKVLQPLSGRGILAINCEIYNWKSIDAKYGFGARNDAEAVLMLIEKKGTGMIHDALDELDGVYAFAYWAGDKVYVCRDIIGEKPVWYSRAGGFAFASEKKALLAIGIPPEETDELNPRTILVYDTKRQELDEMRRGFFSITPETKKDELQILREVKGLLIDAAAKRVPDQKFGILFSGGLDSVVIAMICKSLGVQFTCYTAAFDEEGKLAEDLVYAKKAAKEMGFPLKTVTLNLAKAEEYIGKVVPVIEHTSVVRVGVGVTFYAACEEARKDGIKVMFSGLGSEEIFAGYERHRNSANVNNECISGLLKVYENDLYRDDTITMRHNMELRIPFLDTKLVDYALKIPAKYKVIGTQSKMILRKAALEMGVPAEFAMRKKRAAQYGSRFDKAIERLTRKKGLHKKSEFLNQFYKKANPRLGVLFSSGKDSCYAMHIMRQQFYPVACLITLISRNPDSYMFHTPNVHMAKMQADAMNTPLVSQETSGEKEKELDDMKEALIAAKKKYRIEGVVTGALYSNYQRERVEKVCDSLGLKIFSPLWHMEQEKEMRQLIDAGFEIVFSSVAAEGLDAGWLGCKITQKDVDRLVALNKKTGLNIAGEGGEFESLVLDGPLFKRRIDIVESETVVESENCARFVVKKAKLSKK
jgi:asparagine synthase (glutamine-hydrolysing)